MTVVRLGKSVDPVDAAREARERARDELARELEHLKADSKSRKRSVRLRSELEALQPKCGDPDRMAQCVEMVMKRLEVLKKGTDEKARSCDQRDLRIILVFGAGKLPRELLYDAFALLQLRGTLPNRKLIAEAFPGFYNTFGK